MAIPIVTNRAPAPLQVTKVNERVRFSLRAEGSIVDRSTVAVHLGSGPVFYEGGVLPENVLDKRFFLDSIAGPSTAFPARNIEPDSSLKIEKLAAGNQNSLYFFGGLQAPMAPDSALMVEFTLKLAEADVAADGNNSGVIFGFMVNDTGLMVRFMTNGASRWIEIFDAGATTINRIRYPTNEYLASYDWDQGIAHTYKVLWAPEPDKVRLYVSTGQSEEGYDELLVDGKVSDFSALPTDEIRSDQPWAFFGHGFSNSTSTSYWYNAFLFNNVSTAIWKGIVSGDHNGFIVTNNQCDYDGLSFPKDADQPWMLLPDSFGSIDGGESLDDQSFLLTCLDAEASYGFYRREVGLGSQTTVLDFEVWGESISREAGVDSTGMEVYVDDGVVTAKVALLADNVGTNYIGIQTEATAGALTSYSAVIKSWQARTKYRLIFAPSQGVVLQVIEQKNEGVGPTTLISLDYSDLPPSEMPGPGIGFLKNGNVGKTQARMRVGSIRYSINNRVYDPADHPGIWSTVGSGDIAVGLTGVLSMSTLNGGDQAMLYSGMPVTPLAGSTLEFRCRVTAWGLNGDNPIRENSYNGVIINDKQDRIMLVFADIGPPSNRIVYLCVNMDSGTPVDYDLQLLDIRAGKEWVQGTYAVVDWTEFHLYRLEKTVGGLVRLFIDDSAQASLEFETSKYDFPTAPSGDQFVSFGQFVTGYKTESEWEFLRISISEGHDAMAFPTLSDNEVLRRFSHAVDIIVEASNDENVNFTGTPAKFDLYPYENYEDFDEEWGDNGPLNTSFSGTSAAFD